MPDPENIPHAVFESHWPPALAFCQWKPFILCSIANAQGSLPDPLHSAGSLCASPSPIRRFLCFSVIIRVCLPGWEAVAEPMGCSARRPSHAWCWHRDTYRLGHLTEQGCFTSPRLSFFIHRMTLMFSSLKGIWKNKKERNVKSNLHETGRET